MKRFWSNIIEQKAATSWYKRTLTAFSENSTNLLGHLFDKFVRTPELQFAENIGLSYDSVSDSFIMKLNSGDYELNENFNKSYSFAQEIFADSKGFLISEGANGTTKPYKLLSELVSNTTTDAKFVANTTNASYTINIVSGTNFAKGQKVFGSGIPYGTYITDVGVGTLTISNAATATASGVTLTRRKEYNVKAFGTFNIDASIEKDGVFWDFSGSTCIIGNATAFNITAAKQSDFILKGGKWIGNHVNSRLIFETAADLNSSIYLDYDSVKSIGTGRWIEIANGNDVYINNNNTITSGTNYFIQCTNIFLKSLKSEGLLENIIKASGSIHGNFKVPSSVRVLNISCDFKKLSVVGKLEGKIYSTGNSQQIEFDCDFISTNIDLGGFHSQHVVNGSIRSGSTIAMLGDRTDIILNAACLYNVTISINSSGSTFTVNGKGVYAITVTSGLLIMNHSNFQGSGNNDYYSLNVNGGTTIINGEKIGFGGGSRDFQISSGELIIRNDISCLSPFSPIIDQSGGIVRIQNATITHTNNVDNTKPMILKSAGTLIFENAKLKTNGTYKQSFIKCTADTSASKDIYILGHCKTDADGTTYGLLLPFDGSSYAPNAVISEQLTEDTSLTNIL